MGDSLEPFKVKAKKLNDELRGFQQKRQDPALSVFEREDVEAKIRDHQRQLNEMSARVQKVVGKQQEEHLIQLWKEVRQGIKAYAAEHRIDLVLGYGDPLEPEMRDLFPNINRKMQAMDGGGMVPLFMKTGLEISEPVVALLNRSAAEAEKSARRMADMPDEE